jgi:hypothetical protein
MVCNSWNRRAGRKGQVVARRHTRVYRDVPVQYSSR